MRIETELAPFIEWFAAGTGFVFAAFPLFEFVDFLLTTTPTLQVPSGRCPSCFVLI